VTERPRASHNRPVGDTPQKEPSDPQLRVVDRRWWARQDGEEPSGDGEARKPSYVEELERQLAEQNAQLQARSADQRRAVEEFEQVKTRLRRDVGREVERGKRAVLVELLEVLDNLDRAIAAARAASGANETDEGLTRGVELVRDQFLSKLAGFGVARLDALGQPFDAARHEAVTTTPVDEPAQDGTVVAVITEGYSIGDEMLRPASVVVGKHE
jgi:molecular chaperone GrpE